MYIMRAAMRSGNCAGVGPGYYQIFRYLKIHIKLKDAGIAYAYNLSLRD